MPRSHRKFVNVSHKHKIVYYLVAKAASTSIRYAIGCDDQASNAHKRLVPRLPGYLSFTSIRNPWDRLVSVWTQACEKAGTKPIVIGRMLRHMGLPQPCSFKEFATRACIINDSECNLHYRSQYLFMPRKIDIILRFETLEADWQQLQIKRPDLPNLGQHGTSKHKYYLDYYDTTLIEMVGQRYKTDIETFGWEIPKI